MASENGIRMDVEAFREAVNEINSIGEEVSQTIASISDIIQEFADSTEDAMAAGMQECAATVNQAKGIFAQSAGELVRSLNKVADETQNFEDKAADTLGSVFGR